MGASLSAGSLPVPATRLPADGRQTAAARGSNQMSGNLWWTDEVR
jgi:hypothetical protein